MADENNGVIRFRWVSLDLPRRGVLSALCFALLEIWAAPSVRAERQTIELRYRFEKPCIDIPECRTECESSLARSKELDSCRVAGLEAGGSQRCPKEQAFEMRAFYTVVGCVMHFYPAIEIPLSEGQ